jgi:hypothetical protein
MSMRVKNLEGTTRRGPYQGQNSCRLDPSS